MSDDKAKDEQQIPWQTARISFSSYGSNFRRCSKAEANGPVVDSIWRRYHFWM